MKLESSVPTAVEHFSGFDLSFDGVLSQSWGDLVPIVCKEMIPGDEFTCDVSTFVRLAPLASPTYGRIHGYVNYFFVPNRILLADDLWQDFYRGGVSGDESYTLPFFTVSDIGQLMVDFKRNSEQASEEVERERNKFALRDTRKLFTYLGLADPLTFAQTGNELQLNALPFIAYNRIYGDYYYPWGLDSTFDADAENRYFHHWNEGVIDLSLGGVDTLETGLFRLKHACFKKDYLTTAQLRPQRGGQAATHGVIGSSTDVTYVDPDNDVHGANTIGVSSLGMKWATSLQKWLERNNVAGARYFEQILARFGVKIEAEKLNRSVYLGGDDFWVNVSDVTSTAQTEGASLGSYAGKGVGLGRNGVSYKAGDYGFFFAILHLMPESGCPQGLNRMWFRETRFDYFQSEFEETGMQPIYMPEVWQDVRFGDTTQFTSIKDTPVFGYIPRYAEYKYSAPLLAGDFRFDNSDFPSVFVNDLNSMHLYRLFEGAIGDTLEEDLPSLTADWLTLNNGKEYEFNRIFQDTNTDFDHFWTNIQVNLGANRPMLGYIEASTAFVNDDKNGRVNIPAFGMRL